MVEPTYQPTFQPGHRTRFPDRCVASVNRLGLCPEEPCTKGHKARSQSLHLGGELVPAPFFRGRTPPVLRSSWFPTEGSGSLGAGAAFITDVQGSRRWLLKAQGVNEVVVDGDLPEFGVESTVWGNVRVDGVAFHVDGRLASVGREEPWALTRSAVGGKGLRLWDGAEEGEVVKLTVTPMGTKGHAVKVHPKNFLIKVVKSL